MQNRAVTSVAVEKSIDPIAAAAFGGQIKQFVIAIYFKVLQKIEYIYENNN